MKDSKQKSPWTWIPSLYLAEGIPYVAVVTISVIMYKRLGMSNTDIALYTSWLYLPWVIKPFWSPFVDLLKTKRWWIVVTQILLGALFGGIALSIPAPFYIQATMAFFALLAFSSATHDIAADGFYMLALGSNDQAKFVGIRSTFYRIATLFGQGILIMIAGSIESNTGMEPLKIEVRSEIVQSSASHNLILSDIVHPGEVNGEMHLISDKSLTIPIQNISKDSATLFLQKINELNLKNGFIPKEEKKEMSESWWTSNVSKPLGNWIRDNFGKEKKDNFHAGNIGVSAVFLSKKPAPNEEIAVIIEHKTGDESIAIPTADKRMRFTFNKNNWNKPALIPIQLDSKLDKERIATFNGLSGNIPLAWSLTFFVLAVIFIIFAAYHKFNLPKPDSDKPHTNLNAKSILSEFKETFSTFFKKPQIGAALFFMLTYRFSEAQLLKLINPFLLDTRDIGGLGLTTGEVGFVYGTLGIIGLTLGGIIGGWVASKGGLKKWLWPMTLSMLLTILTFVYLGYFQPESLLVINICVFVEQFGYGFGFTAYMLYLMYFSEGKHKTAHYAFCTGFMALGMMLPGMFAGWLQELLGYERFFVWVIICSIIPIVAVALLKIDHNFGKAKK